MLPATFSDFIAAIERGAFHPCPACEMLGRSVSWGILSPAGEGLANCDRHGDMTWDEMLKLCRDRDGDNDRP